jgi:DNA-binding response OmpR family regulator
LRESVHAGLIKRQRQFRHQEVLTQLEQQVKQNLEGILSDAFERALNATPGDLSHTSHKPAHKGLSINIARHSITFDGQDVELSLTEFNLLSYLVNEAPRVVSPQELAQQIMEHESQPWDIKDMMRTHIYRIRQKLKAHAPDATVIRTVRGVGYQIDETFI